MTTATQTRYFAIIANGCTMGHYPGRDADEAIDAYAHDSGYDDFDDLLDRVPGSSRCELDVSDATDELAEMAASEIGAVDYGDVWAIPVKNAVLVVTACELALLGDLLRNKPLDAVRGEWLDAVEPFRVSALSVGTALRFGGVSDLDGARTAAAQAGDVHTVMAIDLQRSVVAGAALPA